MPAIISASGTWSALDNQNPPSLVPGAVPNEIIREHRDTIEQRFQPRSLDYRQSYPRDVDGLQEVMQFAGLFAAGYGIPAPAAIARIIDICQKAFFNTEELVEQRVFTP